ncbi:MAG: hypothetical protein H0T89_14470 [Deltaproteobacteria bacterium]|nr:hypothetical protein [Deltaproteobacteria bacterium]MDQ3296198.1 hypothetical protein [Myxococcota bacterium]
MSGVITIARYEVTRRWPLWVVGFGLGLLPLMFTTSPLRSTFSDLAEMLVVLGIVMSWVVAFATGMSLVGKPLHDGRLSFYFTRPIASSSIASGKILGGVAAIAGMQLALALPLMGAPDIIGASDRGRLAAGLAFVGTAFFAAGLVVGILARSRSRWFIADAIGGMLAVTASVAMFAALSDREAEVVRTLVWGNALPLLHRAQTLLYALVVVAAVVMLGSVIAAVAIGRTDRDRVHRALSFTLWPALTATALFGLAFAYWGIR